MLELPQLHLDQEYEVINLVEGQYRTKEDICGIISGAKGTYVEIFSHLYRKVDSSGLIP